MRPDYPPSWTTAPTAPTALSPVVEIMERGQGGLLVALSDLHIGGDPGQEDFFCQREFVSLLDDLDREPGQVTLLVNGDFFEFLQVTAPPGVLRVQAIVEHRDHAQMFARLAAWNADPRHQTVYVVGNHDSETGWNAAVGAYLIGRQIVTEIALGYEHLFTADAVSGDDTDHADGADGAVGTTFTVYAEHGNEEDLQNAIGDYGHPLVAPVGTHVVTQFVNRIEPLGRYAEPDEATNLSDIDNIYPLEILPWWLLSQFFYRQVRRVAKYVVLPAAIILVLARFLNSVLLWITFHRVEDLSAATLARYFGFILLDVVVVLGLVIVVLWWDFVRWRRRGGVDEPRQIVAATQEQYHVACRDFLNGTRRPQHRESNDRPIDLFLFGHNHSAELQLHDAHGHPTAYGNTGTWMRRILRWRTHFRMPPVFIPRYDLTYITVRAVAAGLEVQLLKRVKPLPYRLGWPERLATFRLLPKLERAEEAGTVRLLTQVVLPVLTPTHAKTSVSDFISAD